MTHGSGTGGAAENACSRMEPFFLLAGDAAANDLLDRVDTTWNRVPGGAQNERAIDETISRFSAHDAAASVPALLAIRRRLAALPARSEERRVGKERTPRWAVWRWRKWREMGAWWRGR